MSFSEKLQQLERISGLCLHSDQIKLDSRMSQFQALLIHSRIKVGMPLLLFIYLLICYFPI